METKTVSFFNKLSFAFLLGTLFLSVFFFLPYSPVSIFAAKGFLVSIGMTLSLFFWLIARLGEGAFTVPKDKTVLMGFFIPIVFLVSSVFSISRVSSFLGNGFEVGTLGSMFILFLIFFFSSLYFQTTKRFWYFYASLFVSAAILILFEVILIIGNLIKSGLFNKALVSLPAGNLVGSWSDFAIFMGLIVLLCIYTLELLKSKGIFKILKYAILVSGFIFLAIVNMSLVWILVGLFSVMLFVYSISFQQAGVMVVHNGGQKKKFPFTALISVLICFVFIVGHSTLGGVISKYIPISNTDIRPNVKATTHIVYKALRQNPLTGTGPNTFSLDWAKWRPTDVIATPFWNTDFSSGIGFIPSFAATTGILGVVSIIIFMFFVLKRGASSVLKKNHNDTLVNYFTLTMFMMTLYSWIILIFYTPSILSVVLTFALSGVLVGLLIYKNDIKVKKISFLEDPRHSFFAILTLMGLLIGTMTLTYIFARKFASVIFFSKSLNVENNIESLNRSAIMQQNAIVLNNNDAYARSLSQTYLSQISLLANSKDVSPDRLKSSMQELISLSQDQANKAVSFNKNNYLNYVNLGNIYNSLAQLQIDKSYENGIESYNQALKLSPNNPSIILGKAQLELANKNKDKALELVDEALSIKPNYADALLFKSQIYIGQGDLQGASDQINKAISYYRGEPTLYFTLGQIQYTQKDYKGAVVSFENAIILNPNYANARFMLGKSYQQVGRNDKALVEFKILQDREPENNDIKEAIRSLSAPTFTPEVKEAATPIKN